MANTIGLTRVCFDIVRVLQSNPEGLTLGEIRQALNLKSHEHIHLDRRMRQVQKAWAIEKIGSSSNPRYVFRGERTEALSVSGVNQTLRAAVLHRARGRCGMCGRSIERDGVRLVVDHKIPRNWDGTDEIENLWAICEECNAGKKDYFSSFDSSAMQQVMRYQSPHMRIGELLKLHFGELVPAWLIEFVAFDQDDWQKRTRELRYLNWQIKVTKKKNATTQRVESFYTLKSFTEWPANPSKWIREFETNRAKRNRQRK